MHYNMEATPAFWSAVAKRSGDTALDGAERRGTKVLELGDGQQDWS
ncbi:hypothetical protein SBV1_2040007 [Verrucomicrobia bacterium]|nr:hypothetical protein SBV1_2040007 [Verrucomicrobiota bacterium]